MGKPLRRLSLYMYNIKLNLKKTDYEGVNWAYLVRQKAQWWILVSNTAEKV
jgi:hypothetical protein